MRARGAFKAAALLATILFATPLWAKKDGPGFHVNKFPEYPSKLSYFEGSDVILFNDERNRNIYRSADAGATWNRVDEIPEGKAFALFMHEYDPERAYILTLGIQHYRTHDRGKTWEMFLTDAEMSMFRDLHILRFHAGVPDRIIFNGMDCEGILCREVAMYTTDGFRTQAQLLRWNTEGCWWAKGSPLFSTGDEEKDRQRVLCITRDPESPFKEKQHLMVSDNYFSALDSSGKIQEEEPLLDTNRPVQGVVELASIKKFLLAAATSLNTDEMALFVTDDTIRWHRAMFPTDHRVDENAYTVLESTEYSIQIDVMTTRPSNPMGVMFTSDSNGTYFTRNFEHTNRNSTGYVDFEKIADIQGIFLLNTVDNWEEVQKNTKAKKHVVTKITFDDGRSFEEVRLKAPGETPGERIHLHSMTDLSNTGRIFSSPAPGLVMGIGNTGDRLKSYSEGNLYISDDAGKTWIEGPKGPHKYEFGDQGSILVAVKDSEEEDIGEIRYSIDHGENWLTAPLPDGIKMRPWVLTTTQDSTDLKFILVGESPKVGDPPKTEFYVISIDFDGLHEATCESTDLEDWFARVGKDGKPACLMGHTQKFRRRKKHAECFMKEAHKRKDMDAENCECTDVDFECDYNFVKVDGNCITKAPISLPEEACKDGESDDTFLGPSGWRLIPGNTCERKSGPQKDDRVERKCSEATTPPTPPASGKIESQLHRFGKWTEVEKHYLERGDSSAADDETIIVRLKSGRKPGPIWITQDHGKTWTQPKDLPADEVERIIPDPYFKDVVYFITKKEKVHYTPDRGQTFRSFEAPCPPAIPDKLNPLSFHRDNKNWLLWVGKKCEHDQCHLEAFHSIDRGDHWQTISWNVRKCEFTGSDAYQYRGRKKEQILCIEKSADEESAPLQLITSNDWFKSNTVLENIKGFATQAEFIVAAAEHKENGTLRALASLDGVTFAEAHFPFGFTVPHQREYTVLDSSTHAINLFVATETKEDRTYGSILKSNSNGTSYVLSISGVNCDNDYYVDFEKMLGLEGVGLVNVVANKDKASEPKKLQTKISHNDGAEWAYLPPPTQDEFGCRSSNAAQNQGDENCALHLHGYTERLDHRKGYSSVDAVGLMFGWGNVGSSLGNAEDADTFMTTDAGITWKRVQKGRWTWSLGDQGSVIVLVQTTQAKKATNKVVYSTDEGASWNDYVFSTEEVYITDISTMRSGGSRNFLLYGESDSEIFTANIDFSGLSNRQCKHDEQNPENSDYYIWSPKHPLQKNDCLFGHVSQYLRKKPEKECYNEFRMQHLYNVQNCTCTRQDYECDYNFELDNHGHCQSIPGLPPLSKEVWCEEHPSAVEWWEPSGYRRLPLTTCENGQEFDKQLTSHPCPGHEKDYERLHAGPSGVVLFFAITAPFAAAAAIGWYVWRNWSGTFGQIRLGEQPQGGRGLLDSDRPWIRYPVIAVSAVVAFIGALPLVASAVWRSVTGAVEKWGLSGSGRGSWSRLDGGGTRPFTTRDSFARGRGDYAVVDDDEGELLGEESDEEV